MIIAMALVWNKDIESIAGLTPIDKHTHTHTYRPTGNQESSVHLPLE